MMMLRLAVGLLLATLYVVFAASLAVLGCRFGCPTLTNVSIGLHRLLCSVLRVRVKRLGAPGSGRRLVTANHVSWLDVLVLGAMEPIGFLAKKEVGANRWTRWLIDLQGVVYVDRTRNRYLPAVNTEIARRLMVAAPIVVFAEATTSDGARLLPIRSSHFEAARQARASVQPVYLNYRVIGGLRATRRDLPTVAWYGDMAFLPSFWRVLACGGINCDVRYGYLIPWDEAPDRKVLARKTETALRTLKTTGRR
jgi:1-acyl-sn-glycerol-3-phosphate acyltransferase